MVRVVAEQFAWNVHYPGADGVFGRTDITLVSPDNPLGLDRNEPVGKDDIIAINRMNLPVGKAGGHLSCRARTSSTASACRRCA